MQIAANAGHRTRDEGLKWWTVYVAMLPLFAVSEGIQRLMARLQREDDEPSTQYNSWSAEVRSQASIATSYALMARSMLQSSERRPRPERLS